MKKKLFFVFIITVLLSGVFLYARDQIIDNAGLLSAGEKTNLKTRIDDLRAGYDFELIILTVDSMEGENDAYFYGSEYLDRMGLYGESWDGCLMLLSMEYRDYAIVASGRGSKILNRSAYYKLEKDILPYLKNDAYAAAFEVFISTWEEFLVLDSNGKSYNFLRNTKTHILFLLGAWIIALLIGLIVVLVWKAQMNTALPKKDADSYIIPGSLALTQQADTFLYSTVTKSAKSSSSSSGGGGYHSGGGRSGGSGKF
jgi:uncharacterized protein